MGFGSNPLSGGGRSRKAKLRSNKDGIEVFGDFELDQLFRKLEPRVQQKVISKALRF